MSFVVKIEKRAINDISNSIEYYNIQQKDLGNKFVKEVNKAINKISINPFYQIRYDDVRCILVNKFPFMIHFSIDEINEVIKIFAVIHTARNPDNNWIK
ncbi:MAG: type II toxin-antitoxin system RelE/ParE family toxin [Bacteroidia bacterium]